MKNVLLMFFFAFLLVGSVEAQKKSSKTKEKIEFNDVNFDPEPIIVINWSCSIGVVSVINATNFTDNTTYTEMTWINGSGQVRTRRISERRGLRICSGLVNPNPGNGDDDDDD